MNRAERRALRYSKTAQKAAEQDELTRLQIALCDAIVSTDAPDEARSRMVAAVQGTSSLEELAVFKQRLIAQIEAA